MLERDLAQHAVVAQMRRHLVVVRHDGVSAQEQDDELVDTRNLVHDRPRVFTRAQALVHDRFEFFGCLGSKHPPLEKDTTMAGKSSGDRRKPIRGKGAKNAAPAKAIRVGVIDYKDVPTLRKFISERGKIRARRITGVSVQEQRLIARAVKNAREMALLPYSGAGR